MKQTQTTQAVLDEICSGRWKVGDRILSERGIASELSVSRVTVRLALRRLIEQNIVEQRRGSGTYLIRKPEKIDVHDVLPDRGLRSRTPRSKDRAFRGKRIITQRLYRLAYLHDRFETDLVGLATMGGMMAYAKRRGHELVIGPSRHPAEPGPQQDFSREVYHPNVDGIILSATITADDLPKLQRIPVPTVLLNAGCMPVRLVNSVSLDITGTCHHAVKELAQAGHKKIAILEKSFGAPSPRFAHECEYLRNEFKSIELLHLFGEDPLEQFNAHPNAPKAMYISDDAYGSDVCHRMAARGIVIGRDIALICQANRGIERGLPRTVGRMEFDTSGLGRVAAHILEYLLDEAQTELPPITLGAKYVPAAASA